MFMYKSLKQNDVIKVIFILAMHMLINTYFSLLMPWRFFFLKS